MDDLELPERLLLATQGRHPITCPHCGRDSHHPEDIRYRFCTVCGYHDKTPTNLRPVEGGFHVKTLGDGRRVDVMRMAVNWRVIIYRPGTRKVDHAWCYFGHGEGRSMPRAYMRAVAAALIWDGTGEPEGYDKRAF